MPEHTVAPSAPGGSYDHIVVRDGERFSASRAYLHPAMDRPNLDVRTEARGTREGAVVDPADTAVRRAAPRISHTFEEQIHAHEQACRHRRRRCGGAVPLGVRR
ncbi:hypothetical protein GTW71_14320 [Streptomyces sp. SID6041]|nr:hypothetical protein [Streptomyces sp. SID6041]